MLVWEETSARMGRWPWPRRYHAALLDRLGEARTVVLDILFPEGGDPEDDALLARAAAVAGVPAIKILRLRTLRQARRHSTP